MERWEAAPLCYALAIVKFPPILGMETHVSSFQDAIRSLYPLEDEFINQGIGAVVGQNGVTFNTTSVKIWQFSDLERSHALVLGPDFLLLHAGRAYKGHTEFLDRLSAAIEILLKTPGMAVAHATALGFRYIDLVEPVAAEAAPLSDYLQSWALPELPSPAVVENVTLNEGAYISSFRSPYGAIRFMVLRRLGGASLPPDLDTPFVRANGWLDSMRSTEYALLDIDHFAEFATAISMDARDIRERFETMHGPLQKLFRASATPKALKSWGMAQ